MTDRLGQGGTAAHDPDVERHHTTMTENQSATEVAYLPEAPPPHNHGHTVAAWVTMTGIMVGALVSTAGVVVDGAFWLFWAGLVVCAGSVVVGGVLRGMGLGQR